MNVIIVKLPQIVVTRALRLLKLLVSDPNVSIFPVANFN